MADRGTTGVVVVAPAEMGPLREGLSGDVPVRTVPSATAVTLETVGCVVCRDDTAAVDAREAAAAVRDRDEAVPLVVVTDDDAVASWAAGARATDVVDPGWPAFPEPLVEAVDGALERYRRHRQLRESERQYRSLVERSLDGVFIQQRGRLRFLNDRFCEIIDRDRSAMLGEGTVDVVHPDDRDRLRSADSPGGVGEPSPGRYELRLVRPDGEVRHCEVSVQRVEYDRAPAVLATVRDRTEWERTEERFRALIKHSPSVVSVLDEEGYYDYVSPSADRVFGHDPAELEGTDAFRHVHPDDRDLVNEEFVAAMEDPSYTASAEYRFEHGDGTWHVFESRGRNRLEDPAVEGFVVNSRDITARRERERALERQNERLEEFASVVSHDLRNPLNIIEGHAALARKTGEDRHFDAIADATERMGELVDSLLTLAREGQAVSETSAVDLATMAREAWETVSTPGADLRIETDPGPVAADADRVRALFENLFRNSVEHGSTDSEDGVTVRVGPVSAADPSRPAEGFYVADDGPGIDPDERDDVFDRGYTTSEDGTGYGLAIVQGVAEGHGWSYRVTESEAGGARFEFTDTEQPY